MMRAFREAAPHPVQYHAETFRQTLQGLMESARGLALVLDRDGPHGLLLASAAPSPFAPVLVAQEMAWWIDPPQRGRWAVAMLDAYEDWASGIGAGIAGLSCFDERTARLYDRRGYRRTDLTYRVI